jgi:L-cysteine:1D-myo-inositol 2-amino-2-deoxy-alpha-D-glucopyranoside ligase
MYVCGITPYDATHMGHAFTYVTFDLLNRAWRDAGIDVSYTQNVTDVDDPLLERANATGVSWLELAEDQIDLFRQDMTALRVLPPQEYVGAVESIPEVVALIGRLAEAGYVYQVDDEYPDWYFTTNQARDFGTVSSYDRDHMLAVFAERGGDPDRTGKRDALDCLVWRLEREGEPAWDSPLGRGRPGWHIECTAISLETLGETFDVQGGGSDLVFPHHEMCAAEGIAATGVPFAKAYVHVAMVGLDGEKMSKSKGNLVLVSRLREQGVDPMAIRLVLLSHHHLGEWSWTQGDLDANISRLAAWRAAVSGETSVDATETVRAVRAAVADDLHADRALEAIDAWAAASVAAPADVDGARHTIRTLVDGLLGVAL